MPARGLWRLLGGFAGGLVFLGLFLSFWAWVFAPRSLPVAPQRAPIADPESWSTHVRAPGEAPAHVVWQDVDYREGPAAAWWPRGESPWLAELVAEGALPPVEERVGPEPVVLAGPDGLGRYGGTWVEAIFEDRRVHTIDQTGSYANLVRWSPEGYPIVPHVARAWEVNDDATVYTFFLRRGLRWSDGHPFTADDILYWYEAEVLDPVLGTSGDLTKAIDHVGGQGRVVKVDDFTVRFAFDQPNAVLLEHLASTNGRHVCGAPRHYRLPYHPRLGDPELIERTRRALGLPSAAALYNRIREPLNPDHPRLWPWVYRTARPSAPYGFVRNPYYFAVDPAGNQLPYIDRLHWEVKSEELLAVSAANGEIPLQTHSLSFSRYTVLMNQRDRHDYDVRRWFPSTRTQLAIMPNLNRQVRPGDAVADFKSQLLQTREFRQALSLAIDREAIVRTAFLGVGQPAQPEPGPGSPFHSPELAQAFIAHDPARASALLDRLGFGPRDRDGMRTLPDGSRLEFYLATVPSTDTAALQLIIDDWAAVGIRAAVRIRSVNLWRTEVTARLHDFSVFEGFGEYLPVVNPRLFVPTGTWSDYAIGYANWFRLGGLHDNPRARVPGAIRPADDSPVLAAFHHYQEAWTAPDREAQAAAFRRILAIAAEELWVIGIATPPPYLVVVRRDVGNVPHFAVGGNDLRTPGNVGMETFFFARPVTAPGLHETLRREIVAPDTLADTVGAGAVRALTGEVTTGRAAAARLLRWLLVASTVLGVLALATKHPLIAQRLVIMVPTLGIISMLTFVIIQLPPGDYLTTLIARLEQEGGEASEQRIREFRELFHLDESQASQYLRWVGLRWFVTFQSEDRGLLQGHLGRSMETQEPVNRVVGDRILLTVLISAGTILLTWAMALPIGIYSAVRQYSFLDYVGTFIGFLGMSVPNFLLAIVLIYVSAEHFGVNVTGLFSPEYAVQPHWSWGKVVDLLGHIWVPIVILGTGSTASMIRVMRGNLLDELRQPYVRTARAKGVRPLKLILKYPVRLALNPFVSGIGSLFPSLISGGAITAIILSLPTVGPLMLDAFRSEDLYLAGSMLMVLSFLAVVGTLVSDLLLLALDPRIRLTGADDR
jgi:ABC-type dipeptide/oligopeptide/nickel transport system permease component/ABC-type transport system substrate-binding protein